MLLKYVTIAVGVGAFAFALKVLLLVGMDAQVAAAIVAGTSSATAIQMLLIVAPGIGLAVALVLIYQAGRMSKRGNPEHHSHSFMIWPPLLALAAAVAAPTLLMFDSCAVIIPLYAMIQAFVSGRLKHGANYLRVVFGVVIILSIFFFYSTDMWLPKERIRVAGTDHLVYVVAESDDSLVGYFPANKAVLRLEKENAKQRQYCAAKDTPRSFASQWKGTPNLPECPGTDKPFPFE
ncbi:hypothetical protein ACIQTW_21215 [Paenarthrobacter sp. NPDC090517]|uniref:hypothetical protein n=1 Tax=Paenarthrobacter sp. NPDC090517 TaxID=3364381 RepID=UPI0038252C5A